MKNKTKHYLGILIPIWIICFFIGTLEYPKNIIGFVLWMGLGVFTILAINVKDGTIKVKEA